MILDGFMVAKKIREEVKNKVELLKQKNIYPKLVVIQIGKNIASEIYLRNKKSACEEVGILFEEMYFDENTKEDEIISTIERLNSDLLVHGILIQSPLPKKFDSNKFFNLVSEEKDVDGFCNINTSKLYHNQDGFKPCTALGVIRLLKEYNIPISGKHVVILGRSNIVGKPLALLFLQEDATVTIIHSKTINKENLIKQADILVSAIGKPQIIKSSMIKKNAVIVDVGINYLNKKIVGDVDFDDVKQKSSFITPVPKGIGPMTIAMLLLNVVTSASDKI